MECHNNEKSFVYNDVVNKAKQLSRKENDDVLIILLKLILDTTLKQPIHKIDIASSGKKRKKLQNEVKPQKNNRKRSSKIPRSENEVVDEWLALDKDLKEEGSYNDDFADLENWLVDG